MPRACASSTPRTRPRSPAGLYGTLATFQPASFGRVYAAYGGVFIVLSILWGWSVDHVRPDRYDLIGGTICLAGMLVIMY